MQTVALSAKFQIVIPKLLRKQLHLTADQKLEARVHEGRIELIPVVPMHAARGMFTGIDTHVPNEPKSGAA